jgi:hypothetical protein
LDIEYGAASPVLVRTLVIAYDARLHPELNLIEPSEIGASLWDGDQPRFHRIWDALLLGVGDQAPLAQPEPRTARRGELDIQLIFDLDQEPPKPLVEALRAHAYEVLALINLGLVDFVVPTMQFQICKPVAPNQTEMAVSWTVEVRHREALTEEVLGNWLIDMAHFLSSATYGEKYRVALELYAAHFSEKQVRVRFILLVIAMEALAESSPKHQVAIDLLTRWQQEIDTEIGKHDQASDEVQSLRALSRELDFRSGDSINNTIRKLFADLPGVGEEGRIALQRRAVRLYNKRSTLVHDGHLPFEELPGLEAEARQLLEMLFAAAIEGSKPEGERFKILVEDVRKPKGEGDKA